MAAQTQTELGRAIMVATVADTNFEAAILAAGYKSRWHWNQHLDPGCEAVREAYRAKVTADNAMHLAFLHSRRSGES